MARLKRDERICPLCGESIKSVAVRCRYCHAEVEAQAEVGPQARSRSKIQRLPGPTEARPDPPVAGPDPEPAGTVRTARAVLRRNVTVVLAGLVVLAAVGVGASWWQAEQSSAVAPNGALVGDEARTQVLVEAADLSQRALSYNYKSLDNDMEVARARMTASFQKEYDATMTQVRDNTEKNKISLQAVVVSSAIISATEHEAKVLLFLNQTTEVGTTKKQQLSRNSLVVTLTRGDGDWLMSKLTALG